MGNDGFLALAGNCCPEHGPWVPAPGQLLCAPVPQLLSLHTSAGHEAPGSSHKGEDLQPVRHVARKLSRLT